MTDKECIEWLEAINRDRDREGASTLPIEFAIRGRAAFVEAWDTCYGDMRDESDLFLGWEARQTLLRRMDSLDPRKKAGDDPERA